MRDYERLLASLERDRPAFHGTPLDPVSCHIDARVLTFILENVAPGSSTLETGSGYSTVAFAAVSGSHTVISPDPSEHARIREFCAAQGLRLDGVTFHAEISQTVLPRLVNDGPLDCVLIDGDHAFPNPFLDWYYSAERLCKDGLLLVDDVDIRSGHELATFLSSERGRWQRVAVLGKTAVFRRMTGTTVVGLEWTAQPWGRHGRYAVAGDRWQTRWAKAQTRLRLRSRLRERLSQSL